MIYFISKKYEYSPLAQSVEHSAVNRVVVSSSLTRRAIKIRYTVWYTLFSCNRNSSKKRVKRAIKEDFYYQKRYLNILSRSDMMWTKSTFFMLLV